MKRMYKLICFVILPMLSLLFFIIIGKILTHNEYYSHIPSHHAMDSDMFLNIWIGRGIYTMVLIMLVSFVLYSKITNIKKTLSLTLLILLNVSLIYFMYIIVPHLEYTFIILIANGIAFAPFYFKAKVNL